MNIDQQTNKTISIWQFTFIIYCYNSHLHILNILYFKAKQS